MIYLKCPTCKTILSDKQLQYEELLDKICKDEEMNNIDHEQAKKFKAELIKAFKLRYCCSVRLMSYIKLIDIIK